MQIRLKLPKLPHFSSPTTRKWLGIVLVVIVVIGGLILGVRRTKTIHHSAACDKVEKELTSLLTGSNVMYYKGCFVPQALTIKPGTSIIFTDYGDDKMWVATDPYPKENGLRGFNSGQAWAKGQSYGYTFEKVGTYGYHNHVIPSDTGTIVVKN
jgi:plastocyanin